MNDRPLQAKLLKCLAALLAFAAATTATAVEFDFRGRSVFLTPSGGDDTVALQSAFDACIAIGPGCTVRLGAGTYRTRQLVIEDFHGTFVGAGMDATVLEPAGILEVNANENVLAELPSPENPWPFLLLFLDADMTMRDLGFRVTEPVVTSTWHIRGMDLNVLATLVMISGDRSRVDVERIAMDSGEGTFFGVNVINGLYFQGVLPGPSGGFGDRPPLSGVFTVKDSRFTGPDSSIVMTNVSDASLFIRGSYLDGNYSLYLEDFDGSTVVAVDNEIRGSAVGAYAGSGAMKNQEHPGRLVLFDNTIHTGPDGFGVQVLDYSEPASLDVVVVRNQIHLEGSAAGVMGVGAVGTVVRGNVLVGSAIAGVQVGKSLTDGDAPPPVARNWVIAGNDVGALDVSTAQVWVTDGAEGTYVTCESTVLDEGTTTVSSCR